MRNSAVLSIILGLWAIAQADALDSHVRLDLGKIQSVLPRNANQDQNEDGNKNGKASKPKLDGQVLAAVTGVEATDTGEPCEHQTTVIVTETAAGAAAAVVTGVDSGNSQNNTGKDTKTNKKNKDQDDNEKVKNKNADSDADSDGGRGKGSQKNQEKDQKEDQKKDQGNVVQVLTVDIGGNNANHAQGNDKTVTVTETQVIDNVKANADGSQALQLSFVTETIFGAGNAPTVTVTPIAQIVTQHVTITEKAGAAEAVTVTMHAEAVTITQQAQVAAAAPPSTVTITEPGVCTTTDGLAAAATVVSNVQPSAAVVAEAAPSPIATGSGNGMGIIDAAGKCGNCHCLCGAQDFPSASIQIAAPVVGAAAAASPITTLQTVVTFADQAGSTAAVAEGDAGAVSQAGAEAAASSVAPVEAQPSADAAVDAAQSETAPSEVAQGAASDTAITTDASNQSTDAAAVDTATQSAAETTAAEPSISETAAGVFPESSLSATATGAVAEPTTITSPDAAVTIAPPSPGALAVDNGGGPPAPIDINTYSLASAIALGHLRRR